MISLTVTDCLIHFFSLISFSLTLHHPQKERSQSHCRKHKALPCRKTFQIVRLLQKWFPVLFQALLHHLPRNPPHHRSGYLRAGLLLILTPLSWTQFIPPSFKSVLKSKKTGPIWGHLTQLHPSVPYRRLLSLWSTKPHPTPSPLYPRQVPQSPLAHAGPVPSVTQTYPGSAWKQQRIPLPRGHPNPLRMDLHRPYKGNQSW